MTTLRDQLDQIARLDDAATQGKWGHGEGVCGPYLDYPAHTPDWSCNDSGREALWLGGSVMEEDRAFIAALVNWYRSDGRDLALNGLQVEATRVVGWVQEHKDGRKSFYAGDMDPREIHDNGCPTYPVYRADLEQALNERKET